MTHAGDGTPVDEQVSYADLVRRWQRLACLDCVPMIALTVVPAAHPDEDTSVVVVQHPSTCPSLAKMAAADALTNVTDDGTIVHLAQPDAGGGQGGRGGT